MWPYYAIGVIVLGAALVPPGRVSRRARVGLALALALLPALMAGLRSEDCCRDYVVYRDIFDDSPVQLTPAAFLDDWQASINDRVDGGWVYGNALLKWLGIPFEGVILIVAATTIALTVAAYVRTTAHPLLALALYYVHPFFYREMIQIRAGLACAVMFWAYIFVAERRRWSAAIAVVCAVALHLSVALVAAPLLMFAAGVRLGPTRVALALAASYALSRWITPQLGIFATIDRVSIYVDSEYASQLGVFTNPTVLKQVVVLAAALYVQERWGFGSAARAMRLFITSYFFATLWLVTFSNFEIVGGRGASFVSFVEPVLVANVVWRVQELVPRASQLANAVSVALAGVVLVLNLEVKSVVDRYASWLSR